MARFELKNYRNIIVFDHLILISDTFYQSADHFKYRVSNSQNDIIKRMEDIKEIEYNSIGNTLILKFEESSITLLFNSNERMLLCIDHLGISRFELIQDKKLNFKRSIVPILIPVLGFIVIFWIELITSNVYTIFRYLLVGVSFILAMILSFRKYASSSFICYRRKE